MKYLAIALLMFAPSFVAAQDVVVRVRTRPVVVQTYSTPVVRELRSVRVLRPRVRSTNVTRPNVTFQRTVTR